MNAAPIMIMAGGTGGHVYPGLAVAEILQARDQRVLWLGTRRGLEATVVPARGIEIEWISISGIRGKGVGAWLTAPFKIAWAVAQALRILVRQKPGAVLGLGGFVAGPGGVAAWLTRRPLLIHEQNAVAGTTNRLLARLARRVFEAFPSSFPRSVGVRTIGNPVRDSILAAGRSRQPGLRRPPQVLVLGGSQGALALNRCVPAALALIPEAERPLVRHQAGRSLAEAEAAYAGAGVAADCVAFIDDMAEAYAWADFVVARAGALTLAELAAAGVGAILVPFPYAIDDHQRRNAEHFADAGAARLIPETLLSPERLAAEIRELLADPATLERMGRESHALMHGDAARELADACIELAGGRR